MFPYPLLVKIENIDEVGQWKILITSTQAFLLKYSDGKDIIFASCDLPQPLGRVILNGQNSIYRDWYSDKSLVNRTLEIIRGHHQTLNPKPESERM